MNEFIEQLDMTKYKFMALNSIEQDDALVLLKTLFDELQEGCENRLRERILEEAEREVAIAGGRLILDRLVGNYTNLSFGNFGENNELALYENLPINSGIISEPSASQRFCDTDFADIDLTVYDELQDNDSQRDDKGHVCEECGFSATNRKALYRHGVKEKHRTKSQNGSLRHTCTLCDFSSSRKYNLDRHLQRVHFPVRNHSCAVCNNHFKDKETLRQHIKRVHERITDSLESFEQPH